MVHGPRPFGFLKGCTCSHSFMPAWCQHNNPNYGFSFEHCYGTPLDTREMRNKKSPDHASYPPGFVRLRCILPTRALVLRLAYCSIYYRGQKINIYPPERVEFPNGGFQAKTPPAEPKWLVAGADSPQRVLFKRLQQPPERSSVVTLVSELVDHPQGEGEIRKCHCVDRPRVDRFFSMALLIMGIEIHPCDLRAF